jgi:hypothetical protein
MNSFLLSIYITEPKGQQNIRICVCQADYDQYRWVRLKEKRMIWAKKEK